MSCCRRPVKKRIAHGRYNTPLCYGVIERGKAAAEACNYNIVYHSHWGYVYDDDEMSFVVTGQCLHLVC